MPFKSLVRHRTHLHVYMRTSLRDCVPQQGCLECKRGYGHVVLLRLAGYVDVAGNPNCSRDVVLTGGDNSRAMLHSTLRHCTSLKIKRLG